MRRAAFRIFPRQTLSARARPPHTGAPHPQPAAMRRRISFGESVAICRGLLYTGWCCGAAGRARGAKAHTERYRSGHNGGASKALWEQSHVGSNPTLSAKAEGPCSAWAPCFAFGQVGFEGRNRRGSGGASPRPGENGQETAPRGAQAGRRPCGESHPLAGTGGEGPCSAWALCFAFGQVGFEGRNRKCRSAAFSRPGGAPPREPRPRPGGERAREQIRPAGGCPAGAARRAAAPCAQTSVSPPANPLRFPRHIISGVTCKSTREPSTAFTAMKSRSGSPSPRSSS